MDPLIEDFKQFLADEAAQTRLAFRLLHEKFDGVQERLDTMSRLISELNATLAGTRSELYRHRS